MSRKNSQDLTNQSFNFQSYWKSFTTSSEQKQNQETKPNKKAKITKQKDSLKQKQKRENPRNQLHSQLLGDDSSKEINFKEIFERTSETPTKKKLIEELLKNRLSENNQKSLQL